MEIAQLEEEIPPFLLSDLFEANVQSMEFLAQEINENSIIDIKDGTVFVQIASRQLDITPYVTKFVNSMMTKLRLSEEPDKLEAIESISVDSTINFLRWLSALLRNEQTCTVILDKVLLDQLFVEGFLNLMEFLFDGLDHSKHPQVKLMTLHKLQLATYTCIIDFLTDKRCAQNSLLKSAAILFRQRVIGHLPSALKRVLTLLEDPNCVGTEEHAQLCLFTVRLCARYVYCVLFESKDSWLKVVTLLCDSPIFRVMLLFVMGQLSLPSAGTTTPSQDLETDLSFYRLWAKDLAGCPVFLEWVRRFENTDFLDRFAAAFPKLKIKQDEFAVMFQEQQLLTQQQAVTASATRSKAATSKAKKDKRKMKKESDQYSDDSETFGTKAGSSKKKAQQQVVAPQPYIPQPLINLNVDIDEATGLSADGVVRKCAICEYRAGALPTSGVWYINPNKRTERICAKCYRKEYKSSKPAKGSAAASARSKNAAAASASSPASFSAQTPEFYGEGISLEGSAPVSPMGDFEVVLDEDMIKMEQEGSLAAPIQSGSATTPSVRRRTSTAKAVESAAQQFEDEEELMLEEEEEDEDMTRKKDTAYKGARRGSGPTRSTRRSNVPISAFTVPNELQTGEGNASEEGMDVSKPEQQEKPKTRGPGTCPWCGQEDNRWMPSLDDKMVRICTKCYKKERSDVKKAKQAEASAKKALQKQKADAAKASKAEQQQQIKTENENEIGTEEGGQEKLDKEGGGGEEKVDQEEQVPATPKDSTTAATSKDEVATASGGRSLRARKKKDDDEFVKELELSDNDEGSLPVPEEPDTPPQKSASASSKKRARSASTSGTPANKRAKSAAGGGKQQKGKATTSAATAAAVDPPAPAPAAGASASTPSGGNEDLLLLLSSAAGSSLVPGGGDKGSSPATEKPETEGATPAAPPAKLNREGGWTDDLANPNVIAIMEKHGIKEGFKGILKVVVSNKHGKHQYTGPRDVSTSCHGCSDKGSSLVCGNYLNPAVQCTKVICFKCLQKHGWNASFMANSGHFSCFHCLGACLRPSRCTIANSHLTKTDKMVAVVEAYKRQHKREMEEAGFTVDLPEETDEAEGVGLVSNVRVKSAPATTTTEENSESQSEEITPKNEGEKEKEPAAAVVTAESTAIQGAHEETKDSEGGAKNDESSMNVEDESVV